MTSQPAFVLPFCPSPKGLERRVRLAAANSNVAFEMGVVTEITQRGISDLEVQRFLKRGVITGAPQPGTGDGGWQCELRESERRRRSPDIMSVTVELYTGELWVIKIRWVMS